MRSNAAGPGHSRLCVCQHKGSAIPVFCAFLPLRNPLLPPLFAIRLIHPPIYLSIGAHQSAVPCPPWESENAPPCAAPLLLLVLLAPPHSRPSPLPCISYLRPDNSISVAALHPMGKNVKMKRRRGKRWWWHFLGKRRGQMGRKMSQPPPFSSIRSFFGPSPTPPHLSEFGIFSFI